MHFSEDTEPDWTLYVGGEPVGLLSGVEQDMPWMRCNFEPLEGWEAVRALFDLHNEAGRQGFPRDKLSATKAILDRGVELRPSEPGTEAFQPFMIYVEGGKARFRR
ncbi:hypothetical protein [Streptomyces sp. NPDC051211]|uniref:hypothetical protein n=1 Tax=Streptomyces sp. NPDC051211 TaxID=3154643 RepID=UPI00344B62F2